MGADVSVRNGRGMSGVYQGVVICDSLADRGRLWTRTPTHGKTATW
ncbi:Uncharacterised protein [Mycobacterium tuberculosis]|nr:Uncharacterised protein [Mycobacterium tuberculosis]